MTIDVNGVTLYYAHSGEGPPLILLHGNGEDHTLFDGLVEKLGDRFTCYAIDSRGHGQSTPTGDIGYEVMAEDVAAFIGALGLERPVLLGFSDGAIIGLLLASRRPGLLSALVSCGANTNPRELRGWFRAVARLGWWVTRDPKLRMMLTEPNITSQMLAAIRVPTLVVAGSRDILPVRYTRRLAGNIPGSTLLILRGETHDSYIRHDERLCAAMRPFLEECRRGQTP